MIICSTIGPRAKRREEGQSPDYQDHSDEPEDEGELIGRKRAHTGRNILFLGQ